MKKDKDTRINKCLTIGVWVLIIGIWYLATKMGWVTAVLVPSPKKVLSTFVQILTDGYAGTTLLGHLAASFRRMFIALAAAILAGIPLGLLSGYYSKVRAVVDSIVEFYRPLPPLAYYTLLVLWMGIEDSSKIMLLFLAGFAPIYISCVSAVSKVNQDYILSAKCLGATQNQIFFKIVLPACLPEIFVGLRTAVGVEYTTLVAAEMVAASSGIGWMVLAASIYLKSDVMFVGIILMGFSGIAIDFILKGIEKKIVFWKGHV